MEFCSHVENDITVKTLMQIDFIIKSKFNIPNFPK